MHVGGTMKQPVLILGATSAIARAVAHELAQQDYPLFLAGRDLPEMRRIAQDIQVRFGVTAECGPFDAEAFETHLPFLKAVIEKMHGLHGVVYACGDLGDAAKASADFNEAHRIIDRNFTGAVSILTHSANYLSKLGSGFIVGISSVAGDRGRQSNYIYGSAKGALSIFLQGLRNRLMPFHVHVMTVKPGFVDTAMTYGKPGMFLVASPEMVGKKIIHALHRRRDIVYTPWFWRWIMAIIKGVPETVFKRLKL